MNKLIDMANSVFHRLYQRTGCKVYISHDWHKTEGEARTWCTNDSAYAVARIGNFRIFEAGFYWGKLVDVFFGVLGLHFDYQPSYWKEACDEEASPAVV